MGMDDGANVGAHAVDGEMHHDLTGALTAAFDFRAFGVDDDEIVRRHHPLADVGGGAEIAVRGQPDAKVAVVGGHPALLIHEPADFADLLAQVALIFGHGTYYFIRGG